MQTNTEIRTYNFNLGDLSPHLFWEYDADDIDPQKNINLIVQRVLSYGLINDWRIIKQCYGIEKIAEIAKSLREIDPKAVSFISLLAKVPKEQFLCYNTTRLQNQHWNF